MDSAADGEEPAEDSASIAKARRESLSSMGVSFVVSPGTEISYEATWGEYRRDGARFVREQKTASGQIEFDRACSLTAQEHGRATIKWIARELRGKLIARCSFSTRARRCRKTVPKGYIKSVSRYAARIHVGLSLSKRPVGRCVALRGRCQRLAISKTQRVCNRTSHGGTTYDRVRRNLSRTRL